MAAACAEAGLGWSDSPKHSRSTSGAANAMRAISRMREPGILTISMRTILVAAPDVARRNRRSIQCQHLDSGVGFGFEGAFQHDHEYIDPSCREWARRRHDHPPGTMRVRFASNIAGEPRGDRA